MNLRLSSEFDCGAALRAVLLSLARQSGRDLELAADNPEGRIHNLRTGMKKFRALLRLAGEEVSDPAGKALIDRVRILKDGMAGSRDDVVIHKTVRRLLGASAAKRLGLKLPHGARRVAAPESMLRAAGELVALTESLDLDALNASKLKRQWKRQVRDSRKAMERAAQSCDAHDFHTWRKRVKTVWYQCAALAGLAKRIGLLRRPFEKLSGVLGDEHDITIVLETVPALTAEDRLVLEEERKSRRSNALGLAAKIRA